MITDYLLKFPSKAHAEQFGVANGFAAPDENGVLQTTLASHTHALCVIGEHWLLQPDIDGEPQPAIGDGQYWVLFRDLIGIPIPAGAESLIHWTSTSGEPRPTDDPAVPNTFWC
jgi:hypothetical protein